MEDLTDKSVCLVGCGAIGSKLANELVHSGVVRLTLVDHDALSQDNVFRHVLGRQSWGNNKAKALAGWFQGNVPYSQVTAHAMRFDELVKKIPPDELADHDLFVLATGDHTFESWATEYIRSQLVRPVLSTWVEPLGVGGHVLMSVPETPGCLRCLYTGNDGEFVPNRAAFAAPGQNYGEDVSGCGNQFMPFASLDATDTAALAARMTVRFLQDSSEGACLRSWRGSSLAFRAAGYRLSERFGSWDACPVTDFAQPACPVCGSTEDVA